MSSGRPPSMSLYHILETTIGFSIYGLVIRPLFIAIVFELRHWKYPDQNDGSRFSSVFKNYLGIV